MRAAWYVSNQSITIYHMENGKREPNKSSES